MKKSKIKVVHDIKGDGTQWNGTYFHNLEMENGDKINIGKKKKQEVGYELTYELTGQDGESEFPKAKSVNPNPGNYPKRNNEDYTKGIEVGHAINNAVNLMCAGVDLQIKDCDSAEEKIYESAKVIMAISNRLKSE